MKTSRSTKPANMKEKTWRQHLDWLALGGKEVEENMRRQQQQRELGASQKRRPDVR